ncbi:MAG TPA: APC family permease [Chthoniobacterales bacterium]|nr:APC family permease [Chthoniobacterales bacterium]
MEEGDRLAAENLRAGEERVEERSAEFKKELGLRDLALTQILFIIGLSWVGAAGKLGPAHVVLWLLAIAFFYLPSAVVVIYLNRLMPLEGGLYQWAKLGFSEAAGFMVAWNLWLYVITNTSEIGLQLTTNIAYAIGPSGAWIAANKWLITLASALVIVLLVVTSTIGLSIGKWIHNVGGIIMLAIFAALLALPFVHVARGELREYHPLATAVPVFSLFTLNILGKLGFGALGGFEYVAILAGECRSPARTIGRSVMVAAPLIAIMFILGTSSVLAFVHPDQIDLIAPIPQVLSLGFRTFGLAAVVVPIALALLIVLRVAQASVNFTGLTRLPMVAGWDHLMPAWFTKLHPRFKTPANSIFFVGIVTLALGALSLIGVGQQESFQLLFNAGGIFYALTYLVMFALPLFGLSKLRPAPPWWLRLAAASGFLMTLLYVVLSVFPIIAVQSNFAFTLKITAVISGANLLGAGIFLAAKAKRARTR